MHRGILEEIPEISVRISAGIPGDIFERFLKESLEKNRAKSLEDLQNPMMQHWKEFKKSLLKKSLEKLLKEFLDKFLKQTLYELLKESLEGFKE